MTDDFDGKVLSTYETVQFGIGDTAYEFDTTPKRASEFRTVLLPYLEASRPVPSPTPAATISLVPVTGIGKTSAEQNRAVRDWSRANGFQVSDRGPIPGEIVAAFDAAHEITARLRRP